MSSLIQGIYAKRPEAMRRFYNEHNAVVFATALQLLSDPQKANDAVKTVFESLFTNVPAGLTDDTAADYVKNLTAAYCVKQLSRTDAKAMRAPQDRRFRLPKPTAVPKLSTLDAVLASLPAYYRVLFVLSETAALNDNALAAAVKLDVRTLKTALADNRCNVEAILDAAGNGERYEDAANAAKAAVSAAAVTPDTDKAVGAVINKVCAEAQKARTGKRNKILLSTIGIVVLVGFVCVALMAAFGVFDEKPPAPITSAEGITASHYANIDIEDYGTIKVALDSEHAPQTVENFVNLAESGFYDGLTFHRIMEGFMMQGGCPEGNGTGGAEEDIFGEFAENGFDNPLEHTRGAISMARAQDYNSASSQFFIVHEDNQPSLDGKYAAFGYVVEGMDIVDAICTEAEPTDNNGTILSADQPVINTITIEHVH